MSEYTIYSYYEEGPNISLKEKLADHIGECMSILSRFNYSKMYKYLMRIPCEWSIKPSDAIRLLVAFHDVGKIFYQRNFEYDEKRNIKYLSFKGHEFLSFYIFRDFSYKFAESEADKIILSACNFSILFHHHAMNPKQRTKVRMMYDMTLEDLQINELKNILTRFLRSGRELKVLKDTLNTLTENIKSYGSVKLFTESVTHASLKSEEWRKIWEKFVGYPIFRKISLAFLATLLTVDWLSAYKLRGGGELSDFHVILMDFHNYYLG